MWKEGPLDAGGVFCKLANKSENLNLCILQTQRTFGLEIRCDYLADWHITDLVGIDFSYFLTIKPTK